jgi:hypothetical protein
MNKKGFVTFVNNNPKYIKLNDILIESILDFTNLEVEVNCINFDYKHSNPRVITKKINLKDECIDTIFYAKNYASYTSNFDIGLQFDADVIVTPDVINLFESIPKSYNYVKGSRHPWDGPLQYPHINTMNLLGAKEKTQPYIHATYLFTKNSHDFLKEVYNTGMHMFSNNFSPINYDETILNVLLWKNGVTDGFVDCYDPYFEHFKKNIGLETRENCDGPYCSIPDFNLNHYVCHACKDPEEARLIFNKLKQIYNGEK